MSRIKIIAIDGGDNVGKSTIAKMLSDYLDIELIKFPNENKIDTLKTLTPGTYIFDRYKISEVVDGLANGVNEQYVRNSADLLPDPDITFLLTGRSYGHDADIYGNDEYQSTITKLYLTEAKNSSGRIEIINNEKSADAVLEEVFRKMRGII